MGGLASRFERSDSLQSNGVVGGQARSDAYLSDTAVSVCENGDPIDVIELNLPANMFRKSAGVAFDLGGSRCKVSFIKSTQCNGKNCESNGDQVTADQVTVVLAVFRGKKLNDALKYVKNNFNHSALSTQQTTGEKRAIRISGMSMALESRHLVEQEFQAQVQRVEEFNLAANGLRCLLRGLSDADVFHEPSKTVDEKLNKLINSLMQMMASTNQQPDQTQQPPEQPSEQQQQQPESEPEKVCKSEETTTDAKTAAEEPFMIVCCGSGTSCTLVTPDGGSRYLNGSTQGGVVLLGLSKLILGVDNYEELMKLAERGDETRISTVSGDLRNNNPGEKIFYDFFPEEVVVLPFGKVVDRRSEGARREDVAIALVNHILGSVAMEVFWVAAANNCNTVYAMGGVFEHKLARDAFEQWFRSLAVTSGRMNAKCRLVKHSSIIPALGALVD